MEHIGIHIHSTERHLFTIRSLPQDKLDEVERLNDRIAEAEAVNREKDNMISDMQRKLDFRYRKGTNPFGRGESDGDGEAGMIACMPHASHAPHKTKNEILYQAIHG